MQIKKNIEKIKLFAKNYEWKFKVKIFIILLIILLVTIDQVTKLIVSKKLDPGVEYIFLPGFINIQYVLNHGSAFGLNQNKTKMLIVIAFIIILVLLIWLIFSKSKTNLIAISFIMAGTIGNLADRFLHNGGVVDFFAWELFNPKTIFNTADMMISIGIGIIIIYIIISAIWTLINNKKMEKISEND